MRIQIWACSLWLLAGCGVAREPLGELPDSDAGSRIRDVNRPVKGEDDPERDAGESASPDAGTSAAGSGGSPAADSGAATPDPAACAADSCKSGAHALGAYCDQPHALCPRTQEAGRARVCSKVLHEQGPLGRRSFVERATLANTCGGTTVRLRLTYGTVEYHYGADDTLRALTTVTSAAAGPCDDTVYRYGDASCAPEGQPQELPCEE